jgi:hypothetical protein
MGLQDSHYGLNAAKAALWETRKQYFDTHQLSQPVPAANPPRSLSGTKTEG